MAEVNTTVFAVSFAAYTLAIVLVGLYSARYARRSDTDYFLANRSLGPWIASLSASASSESGWVTLGLVGWAYSSGVSAYWIIPGCLLGFAFNWFVLAARIRDRAGALDALTIPDLFALHYRERTPVLRVLSVLVILVAMTLYVAAQFAAAGKAFEATFALNYRVGVLIGAGIVLVYTVTGGFRAVCWTDFLQALLMVGTLVFFPIYLLATHGGFGVVTDRLESISPELLEVIPQSAQASSAALIGFLLGSGALGINLGYPGQPHVLVRFMALRDRREAFFGGVIAMTWGALVYWGAVTVGLVARSLSVEGLEWTAALEAEGGGELGLVVTAANLLPELISGVVLAAVLAAICSTADSQLVVAASAAANDLVARLRRDRVSEAVQALVNRATVLLLGVLAVALVVNEEVEVYGYVLEYGWAILGAAFGPQIILMTLWRRSTWAGCVVGMVTGFTVALVWKRGFDNTLGEVEVYNLTLGFVAAFIANVAVSLVTAPPGSGASSEA
ncbi:MAG: sodium/proline symporter [Phycisphaerales bacterium]